MSPTVEKCFIFTLLLIFVELYIEHNFKEPITLKKLEKGISTLNPV